jgi:hypothetical protein
MSRCRACNNAMTDTEMKRKDPHSGDYTDLCSACLVVSVEALLELDGMVTDIETIQLLDEREVDYISEDDIISFVQKRDSNFEDNY